MKLEDCRGCSFLLGSSIFKGKTETTFYYCRFKKLPIYEVKECDKKK